MVKKILLKLNDTRGGIIMREVKIETIRSIDRAIDILQAFTIEKPFLSLDEIAKITKIPRSTAYRILYTLETRKLVQIDKLSMKYKIGLRMFEFSTMLTSTLDVYHEAEEPLNHLFHLTNQTVLMALKDDDQIVYVFKKEMTNGLKFASITGQRRPYIYGVLGPVLLAYSSESEINRILDLPVDQHTDFTVTDITVLRERLKNIKEEGIFFEKDETNIGVTGIGAPVFGGDNEIIAAIAVVSPSIQLTEEKIEHSRIELLKTAAEISSKMGYSKVCR